MSKVKRVTCPRCGKESSIRQLYNSKSDLYKFYGVIPICKDCIKEIYNNLEAEHGDTRKAIYELCRMLDLPFNTSALDAAQTVVNNQGWQPYQAYITQINSFGAKNNYGTTFADSESFYSKEQGGKKESINYVINEEFKVTPEMVLFWGKGYSKEQYYFLESFYMSLLNTYECETPIQENLYKNIAKAQLQADIALEDGKMNDYDKAMKTLSTLMNDANIKPVQETGADAPEQATFGTLIKKWENEKPIPEPLDEWKRANWIEYVKVWFLSHLCKMTDTPNIFEDEYNKYINMYKVEQSSPEDGDD